MTLATALTAADEWLLDRIFQPIADRLTDKPSAFDVGISMELGAVVLELASDAALFAIGRLGWSAALYDGFSCACGMWFYVFMSRQRGLVRAGKPNPLRIMYRSMRLLALGFALYSVFTSATSERSESLSYALSALSNFAFVAGMYLISCHSRPPGWRLAQRQRRMSGLAAPSWS